MFFTTKDTRDTKEKPCTSSNSLSFVPFVSFVVKRSEFAANVSGQPFSDGAQQLPEPERLREPAASALSQKLLRVASHDIAGDEDDAPRQLRGRRLQHPVERLAVQARHLEIAQHQIVRARTHARD